MKSREKDEAKVELSTFCRQLKLTSSDKIKDLEIDIYWMDVILNTMEGKFMNYTFTAVIKKEGSWWIGWIEEIPGVNCQEKTRQGLMKTLTITLKEAIQFNKEEALFAAKSGYSEAFVQA